MIMRIEGIDHLRGSIRVPGDKSISHRSLISASLADGFSEIVGLSRGEDVMSTLRCLKAMGVNIRFDGATCQVHGKGPDALIEPTDVLNAGNSGTTLRILPGILASQKGFMVFSGDDSLRGRPMKRVVEPLRQMGAQIWGRDDGNFAPLAIKGTQLQGIDYELPVASAQVKSCLLYAALLAEGKTTVIEPTLSRDHTERQLTYLGATMDIYEKDGKRAVTVTGGGRFTGGFLQVPGDISSAAFFLVAAALMPNSEVTVKDLGLNPTRIGVIEVLQGMGADIRIENERVLCNEPVGDVVARSASVGPVTIRGEIIPRVIDELPILAVAATQADGVSAIKDASELRVKESDRIAALCKELKKMGADIEELPDGMIIRGPVKLKGAKVDSHGDHRIAMALAIAGLMAEGVTEIHNAESVAISYPSFAHDLAAIGD